MSQATHSCRKKLVKFRVEVKIISSHMTSTVALASGIDRIGSNAMIRTNQEYGKIQMQEW